MRYEQCRCTRKTPEAIEEWKPPVDHMTYEIVRCRVCQKIKDIRPKRAPNVEGSGPA